MEDEVELKNGEQEIEKEIAPTIKFEVETNEVKNEAHQTNEVHSNDDESEYVEMNEDLAYQYLADKKGVSLEDYKSSLNNRSDNDEYVELDEDYALSFVAEKRGMTVDEFKESLTPKQQKQYAPEITAFNDFYEKTGNKNYNDFLETQKDWEAETPESILKEYIRLSKPDLDAREREYLYNKKYNVADLDENYDEDEIFEKGIDRKEDLRKAKEFFAKRKEEFNVVSGTDEHIPTEYREAKKLIDNQIRLDEEYKLNHQVKRNEFLEKTKAIFNDNFEGFKVKLGNDTIGFTEVAFKPDNIQEVRDLVSDTDNLMRDFHDEEGNLIRQEELQTALYFAKNYKTELNKAYNRGFADKVEADDKLSKNIQSDNLKPQIGSGISGIVYTVEK